MNDDSFFPARPDARPTIYAYEEDNPKLAGCLKVGFTAKSVEARVAEQYPVLKPGTKPYRIVFAEPAMHPDGASFTDHAVHAKLAAMGCERLRTGGRPTEWFRCSVDALRAAYLAVRDRVDNAERRTQDFAMRPEQAKAVEKTVRYYAQAAQEARVHRTPKFLWNAKMRFGKTFATYQLAKRLGAKRVLVLTFKPAVQSAWREDLLTHLDFEGWQFICRPRKPLEPTADEQYRAADKARPIVCFGSFQDYLGYNRETGGIKTTNEWVHAINWDLVVFDEYHFGAWKDSAKKLFEVDEDDVEGEGDGRTGERQNAFYHDYAVNVCAGADAGIGVAALGVRPAGERGQRHAAAPHGEREGDGGADAHRGLPRAQQGHRDDHRQVRGRQEGQTGGRQADEEGEGGADPGGEGVQVEAEGDTGKEDEDKS